MIKIFIVAALTFLTGFYLNNFYPVSPEKQMSLHTVMIVSDKGGGGSGSIVYSDLEKSIVLTNAHVCKAIANGGKVINSKGVSSIVDSYDLSKDHDLCLLKTFRNLGPAAKISNSPSNIGEKVIASGHPNLLPLTLSEGRITGLKEIDVLSDLRPCSQKELESEIACLFFGGMPVVKKYQALSSSVLIMPGSSGSAVYNESAEIVAVVFAGGQGLSYGFLVPWQYVSSFLKQQHNYVKIQEQQ